MQRTPRQGRRGRYTSEAGKPSDVAQREDWGGNAESNGGAGLVAMSKKKSTIVVDEQGRCW